jgi:methylmalonyl-CoA mutase cobalamin-binding domain/chain
MSTAANDLSRPSGERATPPLRFVTAASLFDGHDAAINIMRRLIQAQGVEVVHLGHNRSVDDIVLAAIQEDADGIAVSSYQGGHNEFFRYMVDRLRELGASHIKVFGGGGGTITPEEIAELMEYGVERIYHPHDGMELGLQAMIEDLVARTQANRRVAYVPESSESIVDIAAMISSIEEGVFDDAQLTSLRKEWQVKFFGQTHRGPCCRPDTQTDGWCVAGRSNSHELIAFGSHLHAFNCNAPPAPGDERNAWRPHRVSEVPGLRSCHRRDGRHRPKRQRDCRHGRLLSLRHDQ